MVSPAALKTIGAGIGAVSVSATGTGVVVKDQNNRYQKALEEEKVRKVKEAKEKAFQDAKKTIETKAPELAKTNLFDAGLYGFLDDQDVVFWIRGSNEGSGAEFELTDNNLKTVLLNGYSSANLVIRAKASISEDNKLGSQLKQSNSGVVKIKHLKALNHGAPWDWTCNIKFSAVFDNVAVTRETYELNNKDKFVNHSDGFFDVLKKDLISESDATNKNKWREVKKRFVQNCSDSRKEGPTFMLRTKKDATDKKLYFIKSDKDPKAEKWFDGITLVDKEGVIVSA